MRYIRPIVSAGCLMLLSLCHASGNIITNLNELLSHAESDVRRPFSLKGTILYGDRSPALYCDGRIVYLTALRKGMFSSVERGDHITVDGYRRGADLYVLAFTRIGKAPMPEPEEADPKNLRGNRYAGRYIRVQGTITDIFRDDIDAEFIYFVLDSGGTQFFASIASTAASDEWMQNLIGATVRMTGVNESSKGSQRPFMGCVLRCPDIELIENLNSSAATPFDYPELKIPSRASSQEIASLGRRRISGTVSAVCSDNVLILLDDDGRLHRVALAKNQPTPRLNDRVVAGGTVQTDFYLVNLTHAICKVVGRSDAEPDAAEDVSAQNILFNSRNERQAMPRYYGKAIRLRGTVMRPNASQPAGDRLYISCDSVVVPVDIFAAGLDPNDFPAGSVVSAAGICLMAVENWSTANPFSKINGFSLVARTADDIRLLSPPPWWTPKRIITAAGILLTLLVGIGLWNIMLNGQVKRRTIELARAKIARDRSDLKTDERTRLAVELHDSLSQNLSGLGCQLIATRQALRENAADAERRLETAETMLTSMRMELKRCLFDLRNDALEENDFEKAVLHTLTPVAGAARIFLRFSVPRSQLDDSQAHAVLCIVRELTSNAICHGKADSVRIAGCLDGRRIAFSVRDDGRGFDPSKCDGPLQGHFGLSGVRTRVKRMNGTLEIKSAPGKGTNVKVTICI
jgi:signal transduction histidine kinase